MKIKITFGATCNNVFRATVVAVVLWIFPVFAFQFLRVLDNSHEAVRHSPMSNVTSLKMGFYCGIPYEDCLCSVQSKKGESLKDCLTDNYLLGCRMFTLVSFVMQICLLRDLFSLNGTYARFLVYTLRITVLFIFVIITSGIYQSSCFHRNITGILCCSGILLFGGLIYDIVNTRDTDRVSRTSRHNSSNKQNVVVAVEEVEVEVEVEEEDEGDDPIFWRELL